MTEKSAVRPSIAMPTITKEMVIAEQRRRKNNLMSSYFPDEGKFRRELYPKHMQFFKATAEHKEVAFIAGNRTGKSDSMVYACTCFLTGRYPHWWEGKRFKRPVNILVAGETSKLVRDSIQAKFLGQPGEFGTGMIPKELILSTSSKSGVVDAVDTVRVKHPYGTSVMNLMSYDQGREAFQATARDVIALDEEPPMNIYLECLMRTMTTNGIVMAVFTPMKGVTPVTQYFMAPQDDKKK